MFEFCNWLELAYLYFITKKMTLLYHDQLNIKQELKVATLCWIGFSILYFLINLFIQKQSDDTVKMKLRYFILLGILLRNVCTFYAMTLYTLYTVMFKRNVDYAVDKRQNLRLNILTLDIIMTHQMPFQKFKEFISIQAQSNEVYLNLYCLIELYKTKIQGLLIKAQMIRDQVENEPSFDARYISDPEYNVHQLMIGRSMINILGYIKHNYHTHFRDVKIESLMYLETDESRLKSVTTP